MVIKTAISNQINILFVFLIFFLLNPFFSIFFLFLFYLQTSFYSDKILKFICLLPSIFIGLINSTKLPESDLIWYLQGYLDAGHQTFFEYIFTFGVNGSGKELVFPLFNYIIYQFAGDSTKLYVIIYSSVCYFLMNFSIYRFGKYMNYTRYSIVFSIFLMCFTPYIFTMSAILMRQFLACSLLVYIMVESLLYKKKSIFFIICMVMIHSSSFLFVPFLFFPFINKPISKKTFLIYFFFIFILFSIQLISSILLPLFSDIPLLKYIFLRASQGTTYDLGSLSATKISVSIFTATIPLIIIYFVKPNLKQNSSIIHFFNILFILVLFILANLNQSELSVRLNFYVWQFVPIVVLFTLNAIYIHKFFLYLVIILLLPFFVYYLDTGMWTYNLGDSIFYNTFVNYFF